MESGDLSIYIHRYKHRFIYTDIKFDLFKAVFREQDLQLVDGYNV